MGRGRKENGKKLKSILDDNIPTYQTETKQKQNQKHREKKTTQKRLE